MASQKAIRERAAYRANPERFRAKRRRYYARHQALEQERARERHFVGKYGPQIIEERKRLLKEQDGRCAICGTRNPGAYGWSTDHDHATGKTRGLLCNWCNPGLGNFKDNPELLRKAIEYLRRHGITA